MGRSIENFRAKLKKRLDEDWKPGPFPFQNPENSIEERVDDLVSRLYLKEKAKQLTSRAPSIDRLGIPKYHWWNECLHGVGRAGLATVFPQSTGLGATFDPPLIMEMTQAISDEARAKHHKALKEGKIGKQYYGLTFWSPNVNLFRDPRWGRGQETYGEDPYLMGEMGVNFVKGLQGEDTKYLKLVATAKHYVVHSGPEGLRHEFNAEATEKDIRESYLYAFRECVVRANAYSIMGAYNRTNGELCCASPTFLQKILREEFGFEGFVVSDCGAIRDFHAHHKVTKNRFESAAFGVKNGCDLNCGIIYRFLSGAVKRGYIQEEEIDVAVKRLFTARMKLGMFDPPEMVPFSKIPYSIVDCKEHRDLALKIAKEAIVLLKNENHCLPLKRKDLTNIAVIGPNADDEEVLWGNYNGTPSYTITPLEGIQAAAPKAQILYAKGCNIAGDDESDFEEAIELAVKADVVIMIMGISNEIEGEQKRSGGDDRSTIEIPKIQQKLLKRIRQENQNKPIVLVLINGSPVATPWAQKNISAIIEAWYGGQEGGRAIAQAIFGDYSPAGKMPITVPHSAEDLPDFEDYSMKGRTYRYLEKEPLYPFGFGLSFVPIEIKDASLDQQRAQISEELRVKLSLTLSNANDREADQSLQIYIRIVESPNTVPRHSLVGVERIKMEAREEKDFEFELRAKDFSQFTERGKHVLLEGVYKIFVGFNQPDKRSLELGGKKPLKLSLYLEGKKIDLPY